MAENGLKVHETTGKILELIAGLTPEEVNLVFKHVRDLLGAPVEQAERGAGIGQPALLVGPPGAEPGAAFFLRDKRPQIASHRVVCLAYYLKHYRGVEEFKTQDITVLVTELRLPPFSNASLFVNEAAKAGFLTRLGKGQKAITPGGMAFVEALPDLEQARIAMRENSLGRSVKQKPKKPKAIDATPTVKAD